MERRDTVILKKVLSEIEIAEESHLYDGHQYWRVGQKLIRFFQKRLFRYSMEGNFWIPGYCGA